MSEAHRLQFEHLSDMGNWLQKTVDADKYDLYFIGLDESRELIAIKNVSTSPQVHGSVEGPDPEDVRKVVSNLDNKLIPVRDFDWRTHKATFADLDSMQHWLQHIVSPSRYDLYYSKGTAEAIAIKNVSTSPRVTGVVKNVERGDVEQVGSRVGREVTVLHRFYWRDDQPLEQVT